MLTTPAMYGHERGCRSSVAKNSSDSRYPTTSAQALSERYVKTGIGSNAQVSSSAWYAAQLRRNKPNHRYSRSLRRSQNIPRLAIAPRKFANNSITEAELPQNVSRPA